MSNEISASPVDGANQTPVVTPTETPAPVVSGSETPAPVLSPEQAADALSKARKEAAGYRERLKAFEDAQRVADEAKLSDLDKAQKRIAELETAATARETQTRARLLSSGIRAAATELRIVDPEAAEKLLDHSAIEFDADGEPTNVRALLETLVSTKSYLVAPAPAGNAPFAPAIAPTNPTRDRASAMNLADLRKLTPAQITELDPKLVNQILTAGR